MKSLVITGGGRGIGRATALGAAKRGWAVMLSYVSDPAAAEAVVAEIRASGGTAEAVRCDVAEEADQLALFDAAEARFGRIDAVVANAGGLAPRPLPLAEMDVARLRHSLDVNLLGAALTAREAARRLPEGGALVLVSSMAARLGSPGEYVDYAMAKGGVDTLVLGLAKELGPRGIRVIGIRPGIIETDIHASGGYADRAKHFAHTASLGRTGQPEEVADAILWALDGASYVTGTFLDVSGGR
ncbi:SDR family oxidoreductase [Sphingomonas sp.]|uniref:SDR family oxidoreductase n=1 Tax=Sphingomonas sp. TaxID=28214 RepID=UPI001B15B387|nr:SDR family oxidoreductase [Sphingomonas sp.]MBO9713360.1 SDR family oxidoreductase [Sphingomonas sp.]